MQSDRYNYSGIDTLEVLLEAKRYNAFLTKEILKSGSGATTVMDFGAGIGTFTDTFKDINVIAVERDPTLHKLLEEKGYRACLSLPEVGENSFDFIYSLNVLEHIADDISTLEDLYSKLRPGGRFFYTFLLSISSTRVWIEK